MSLRHPYVTPWARTWLAAHPDEALEVESLRLTFAAEGSLALFGTSARGPFQAIVRCAGAPADGYRGHGRTVLDAVKRAMAESRVAA